MRSLCACIVVLQGVVGCGDDGEATEGGASTGAAASESGETGSSGQVPTSGGEVTGSEGSSSGGPAETGASETGATTGGGAPAVRLPQAVAGAMSADPMLYSTLPVHVATSGAIDAVTVRLDDEAEVAASMGTGTWVAEVAVMGAELGVHTLTATASGPDGVLEASAELVLTSGGIQWTDVVIDGNAGTPVLHRRAGEDLLWLTWADGSEGVNRRGWLEPIDGAGRSQGERVALTPAEDDVPYARAAVGQSRVAVLYQLPGGGPYFNRLRVVDFEGGEVVAPLELEPPGGFGSFGGDVFYDGAGFVATFRSNDGMGGGDVWWMRVEEASGAVTGPKIVASSGDGDPDGGFDPFSVISVAGDEQTAVISFVRERYNGALDLLIPKAQVVSVTADGTVDGPDAVASGSDFLWHWEAKVETVGDEVMLLWCTDDLNDPNIPIPTALRGGLVAPADAVGNDRGQGTVLVQAEETRGEPAFVATEEAPGILLWTDQRSYVDLQNGRIEMMAARALDDSLTVDEAEVVGHARFIAGTAHFGGQGAGTNAVVVWIDERHGNGIVDPKPEVFFETIWR